MVIHRITPNLSVDDPTAGHDFYEEFLGLRKEFDLGWVASFRSPTNPSVQVTIVGQDPTGPEPSSMSVNVADVDAAARGVVVDAGRGEEFLHPLGHGVGLQIHEAPLLGATGSGRLAAGMAVTVEPGVYIEGRGGVRIEDTLVVTDGAPEVLTRFPKDLLEI